ncbi:hypothetical protein EGW08_000775, partial [Elysia chlorotica]
PGDCVDHGELEQGGEDKRQTGGHPHIDSLDIGDLQSDRDGLHVGHGEYRQDAQGDPGRHGAHVQAEGNPGQDHNQGRGDVQLDHVEAQAATELQVDCQAC